jgi:hypothetical protein
MSVSLGFCLIYPPDLNDALYAFTEHVARKYNFDPLLERGKNIPHVSVWQGRFDDIGQTIAVLADSDCIYRREQTNVKEVSTWAEKIVFVNVENRPYFVALQRQIRKSTDHLRVSGSADPQSFRNVEAKYAQSYTETGYPFAEDPHEAVLPHFTLGHLREPASPEYYFDRRSLYDEWNELLKFNPVSPLKLGVFIVEPRGVCRELLWDRSLKSS